MSSERYIEVPVRWGDMDAFGHVNNVVFIQFLEESRIAFMDEFDLVSASDKHGPVIVNVNCNYRREIVHPATLRVSLKAHCASDKRLIMEHTITDADNPEALYADAQVTAVWIDKTSGRAVPLPAEVRVAAES